MATKTPACTGANTAPLTTTNPLMTANSTGTRINGFTGLSNSASLNLKMIAPSTVRKKKAYSASPLSVSKIRMLPSRI